MAAISETGSLIGILEGVLGAKAIALVPERPNSPVQINGKKTSALITSHGVFETVELSWSDPDPRRDMHFITGSPNIDNDPIFGEPVIEDANQAVNLSLATGEVIFRKHK